MTVRHEPSRSPPGRMRRALWWLTCLLAAWAVAAYLVLPLVWEQYFRDHPGLENAPRRAYTSDGQPGDPINLLLAATEEELVRAMSSAGWYPADPITFRTSVRIVVDAVFSRPDDEAPVSSLYLLGRKQDLAFEQPVGDNPRKRHHVRFWREADLLEDQRPSWLGAATFDESVGLSHTTGEVTHHIGPDIDAERDRIASELERTGWVKQVRWVDGYHREREGRNGGGDPWHTDGRLAIVILLDRPAGAAPDPRVPR